MESRHFKILLRWSWLLLLFPILSMAAGYLALEQQPILYEAEATLIIGPGIDSPNPDLNALRAGEQLMQTYVELPRTDSFLEGLIESLSLPMTKAELEQMILMRPLVGTQLVGVVVHDDNAGRAVLIANQVANDLVEQGPSSEQNDFLFERISQQATNIEEDILSIEERVEVLTAQLAVENDIINQNLLVQQINEEERRLSESNATLADLYQTLQEPLTNRIAVIDAAEEAVKLSSQTLLTLIMALGAGVVVSALVGIGLIAINNDVLDVSNVKALDNLPVWATIRSSKRAGLVVDQAPNSENARQYNQLGAHVLNRGNGSTGQSYLFTSLSKTDHVPEIVTNLSVALAKTQNPIILIDADFQNNLVSQILNLDAGRTLSDLFVDSEVTDVAIQSSDLSQFLKAIPSGTDTTHTSFSLLASPRMNQILQAIKQMEQDFKCLFLAVSPMSLGEDSLPLVHQVDGVVLVLQNRAVTVTRVRQVIAQIESLGGQVAGVILVR